MSNRTLVPDKLQGYLLQVRHMLYELISVDDRIGEIDRILVKSISRFARNTKDCLAAIRELKELGVSVLFEEQGIDTARVSSEMVMAVMASLAQKQSESISGNVQWGIEKRMQAGKFITCKAPYGYRLNKGRLQIDETEAAVIREIFAMYLDGFNRKEIAQHLKNKKVPTRSEVPEWTEKTIWDMPVLHNEDHVRLADGREPVRHNEARPSDHHLRERVLNLELGSRINRARRFIENQHRRKRQHHARNTKKLPLSL